MILQSNQKRDIQKCHGPAAGRSFFPGCSLRSSTALSAHASIPFSHTQRQIKLVYKKNTHTLSSYQEKWGKTSHNLNKTTHFPSRKSMSGRSMLSESASTWFLVFSFSGPLIWYNKDAICRIQSLIRFWKLEWKKMISQSRTSTRVVTKISPFMGVMWMYLFPNVLLRSSSTLFSLTCRSFSKSLASVSICSRKWQINTFNFYIYSTINFKITKENQCSLKLKFFL